MKTAAVIAEYNPFHKGHEYHLSKTRAMTDADYLIVVMSGDFVQRGAPAFMNKYLRTRMALAGGADIVLELPSRYALSSAEGFSEGAVSLLDRLGVVNLLSFGSECGSASQLSAFAQQISALEADPAFSSALKLYQKQGLSYPAAVQKAMLSSAKHSDTCPPSVDFLPNNILGVEYCKSLIRRGSRITPVSMIRNGEGYHSPNISSGSYSSASAIRVTAAAHENRVDALLKDTVFSSQIPAQVLPIWKSDRSFHYGLDEQDFSLLMHYKLLSIQEEGYAQFEDCSEDLSLKIRKFLPEYRDFSAFCQLLKSKDLTYTRISRVLMHILLDIRKKDGFLKDSDSVLQIPYARLLGFRENATPLLNQIKRESEIPLVVKPADASSLLSEDALSLFEEDIRVAHIYETVASRKNQSPLCNEYRQSPIIYRSCSDCSSATT